MSNLADRLTAAANLEGDDGAIRIRARYEPGAGADARVSPPTYPRPEGGGGKDGPYLVEDRRGSDGALHSTVLLDSRQSQANRCEEALERAIAAGRLRLPLIVLETSVGGQPVRVTSLSAPHRSRDAYFRDAETADGTPFDRTRPGVALARATLADATPYYLHAPAELVYGVWDSHRDLRLATKFPRVYASEVVGWDFLPGKRAAGRFDLLTSGAQKVSGGNLDWKTGPGGKVKLSTLGLGAIPPNFVEAGGAGVSRVERLATLSFAGLARIDAGADDAQRRAARGVLAALALTGDRLAFARPAMFLRSGCDLVLLSESVEWVRRGGGTEALELSPADAFSLLEELVDRAASAGLVWEAEPLRLRPQTRLQETFDYAHRTAPAEGE